MYGGEVGGSCFVSNVCCAHVSLEFVRDAQCGARLSITRYMSLSVHCILMLSLCCAHARLSTLAPYLHQQSEQLSCKRV